MVGWYHSHPHMGVFFSGQDKAVHRIVFDQPWHIALVVDPSTARRGLFGGNQGELVGLPGYYVIKPEVVPEKKDLAGTTILPATHEPSEPVSNLQGDLQGETTHGWLVAQI